MIRLIAFAAFALALATSAQAMSAPPLHRVDGMTTETQDVGYRYRGVARNQAGLSIRVAAINLRRLVNLGLDHHDGRWNLAT